jgi:oxygen-independent coproporphyrinogen-3 oxidase
VANNSRYIDSLLAGQLNFEKEELSPKSQLNEYIMISLRTREGCDLQQVALRFGESAARDLRTKAERYIQEAKMEEMNEGEMKEGAAGSRLVLTREGKLLADGIASDLFF